MPQPMTWSPGVTNALALTMGAARGYTEGKANLFNQAMQRHEQYLASRQQGLAERGQVAQELQAKQQEDRMRMQLAQDIRMAEQEMQFKWTDLDTSRRVSVMNALVEHERTQGTIRGQDVNWSIAGLNLLAGAMADERADARQRKEALDRFRTQEASNFHQYQLGTLRDDRAARAAAAAFDQQLRKEQQALEERFTKEQLAEERNVARVLGLREGMAPGESLAVAGVGQVSRPAAPTAERGAPGAYENEMGGYQALYDMAFQTFYHQYRQQGYPDGQARQGAQAQANAVVQSRLMGRAKQGKAPYTPDQYMRAQEFVVQNYSEQVTGPNGTIDQARVQALTQQLLAQAQPPAETARGAAQPADGRARGLDAFYLRAQRNGVTRAEADDVLRYSQERGEPPWAYLEEIIRVKGAGRLLAPQGQAAQNQQPSGGTPQPSRRGGDGYTIPNPLFP